MNKEEISGKREREGRRQGTKEGGNEGETGEGKRKWVYRVRPSRKGIPSLIHSSAPPSASSWAR